MKKLTLTFNFSYFLRIFLLISFIFNGADIYAQSKAFIPDINFRNFLNTTYPTFMDGSGDSLLIASAATLTGSLFCNNLSIADLTGIEYFVNIIRLYCYGNQLSALPDLTNNTVLERLACENNQLTALPDLTNNTALQELFCFNNQLTALPPLTNNIALLSVACSDNQLTTLPDLTNNTALQSIDCSYNQLTALPDLTNNVALVFLRCNNNQLTALPDLTNNTTLQQLYCYNNQLTVLPDLTNNTALEWLSCSYNQLTALPDLTNNTALNVLKCFNNQLTALPDLTNNIAFSTLNCSNNQLTALPDLTNNTTLYWLYYDNNRLDFSDARELRINDAITLNTYIYDPQNPFGTADTFNFNVGDTLILSIASQDSALSYQWFRGTDTIAGATDTLLTIPNVSLAESGVYTCRSYGTALDSPPMNYGPGISSFVSEPFTVNIPDPRPKAFIPDINFRNFLNTTYPAFMDGSGDSLIIDSAVTLTGALDCDSLNIADLTGLEYFINITQLWCGINQLTTLPDLTNITALLRLYCSFNQLIALPDLTNNTALQELNCIYNQLTTLPDLTNNTALQGLWCSGNQLTTLPDFSNNTALIQLNCSYNQLTALPDLSNNTALQTLWCNYNQLTALPDLTNNTALQELVCYSNQLTTLPDLTNNTALQWLYCHNNQLTALPNLTNNIALQDLRCNNNKLDFSDAKELRIADNISILTTYWYNPQNPFGIPATFNLNAGETLILSIANQDSALSYQWFRGLDTIVGETDTLLTIPNVTLAESGVYTCRSYGTALLYPSPMTHSPGISSFVSEEFLVNIPPVGISELFDTDNWLKVYPNPGTGEFIIEIENPPVRVGLGVKIKLINIVGQVIYKENLINFTSKYQTKINMSGYAKGIYTLQLSTKKGIITKKIILE